jgi:hypothetical protein
MVTFSQREKSAEEGKLVGNGFLTFVDSYVARSAREDALAWFRKAVRDVAAAPTDKNLAIAIGLAPRRVGKADLALSEEDTAQLTKLHHGLDLSGWSLDQLVRVALVLASFDGDEQAFATLFDRFCTTAEISELIALHRGLPVYPAGALLESRAREAVRSGMKPVFEAVAHRNPYPVEFFSEDAWNQMVVKAFFIGSAVWPIQNLDQRANPHLAKMLVGLAQERWAAGRSVSAEMWRCVIPYADAEGMDTVARAFAKGDDKDRLAIALALRAGGPSVAGIRERMSFQNDLAILDARLESEAIDWSDLVS